MTSFLKALTRLSLSNVVIILVVLILMVQSVSAQKFYEINGWEFRDTKEFIQWWLRTESDYISEILLFDSVKLGGEVMNGFYLSRPTGEVKLLRVVYTGFDKSGNIYLKM